METVTVNNEYTDGFESGAAGCWATENPHTPDSFEWMSWVAGWTKGREYYLDEGWAYTWI